jgi:DNA-binding IclR family transcriptional regulator
LLTHRRLGERLAGQVLLLHLEEGARSLPVATLEHRFGWPPERVERVLRRLLRAGWVESDENGLRLTPAGATYLRDTGGARLAHRL